MHTHTHTDMLAPTYIYTLPLCIQMCTYMHMHYCTEIYAPRGRRAYSATG